MYHGFDRNGLDEIIQNLRESIRAYPGPAHFTRILVHALIPIVAYCLHSRYPTRPIAPVFLEFSGANGHLSQCLDSDFSRPEIHIGADGSRKTVDNVYQEENEESIE